MTFNSKIYMQHNYNKTFCRSMMDVVMGTHTTRDDAQALPPAALMREASTLCSSACAKVRHAQELRQSAQTVINRLIYVVLHKNYGNQYTSWYTYIPALLRIAWCS